MRALPRPLGSDNRTGKDRKWQDLENGGMPPNPPVLRQRIRVLHTLMPRKARHEASLLLKQEQYNLQND